MMKSIAMRPHLIPVLLLLFVPIIAAALDAPHTDSVTGYTITCSNCHWVHASSMPPWASVAYPDAQDDTINNRRCFACHEGTSAPYERTHSTTSTSSVYWTTMGGWTTQCVTCHDPHKQNQTQAWTAETFLLTGTLSSADIVPDGGMAETTITLGNTLSADYGGYYLIPDTNAASAGLPVTFYKIRTAASGSPVMTVKGIVNTSYLSAAATTYAIVYGKNIRSRITYKNPGNAAVGGMVKLFSSAGDYGAGDSVNKATSACYVCHTQGRHWSTIGDTTHNDRADCTTCHEHSGGFRASCKGCHGNPPTLDSATKPEGLVWTTITGSSTAGAHDRHVNAKGINCAACHYSSVGSGTTHNDRSITIGFGGLNGQNQGGTYDGQSGVAYEPPASATTPASTVGNSGSRTCSNIYCHGNYRGSGKNATPAWDNPADGACGTCHDASNTAVPASGSHSLHAGSSNYTNYNCALCHKDIVGGDGPSGYAIVDTTRHVNGLVDWKFDTSDARVSSSSAYSIGSGTASPSDGASPRAFGTCSNIYCHSSVQGNPNPTQAPSYVTPTWGQTYARTCGRGAACHAVGNAHPSDSGYIPLTTGSHAKHLLYKFDQDGNCQSCHYDSSYSGCINCHNRQVNHVNRTIDIVFSPDFPFATNGGGGAYSGDSVPQTAYGSCSNLYCHSQGTKGLPPYDAPNTNPAAWGGSLPSDCTGCHGGDPSAALTIGTGSHATHVQTYRYDCSFCHATTVSGSRTLNSTTYVGSLTYGYRNHTNGWINVAFWSSIASGGTYAGQASPLNYRAPGSVFDACGNTYCHGNGTSVSTGAIPSNSSPNWGGSSAVCTSCHTYPPDYGNGNPKMNSHTAHNYMICGKCHWLTTQTGTAITDYAKHANRQYDIGNESGTISYSYASSGGTCSGAFGCHGTATWGNTMSLDFSDCISCHKTAMNSRRQIADSNGDGTGTGGDFLKTSHHVYPSAGTLQNSDCRVCHDTSQHPGGAIRLKDADTGAIYTYDPANPSTAEPFCLSCHDSNGANGNMAPFSDWTTLGTGLYRSGAEIRDNWLKTYGHRQTGLTCLGNGDPNTGCHSNGHGSGNVGLLAKNMTLPTTLAAQGAPFQVDDEGAYQLCFTCHQNYPRVKKEAILGVKAGSKYDWDHWWGVMPPYYTTATQTNFKDRYDASGKTYDDQEGWRGPGEYYNLHFFHLQDRNWWDGQGGVAGAWKYRDSIDSGTNCLTCHSVHGSNTQSGWVHDEMKYTRYSGEGPDKYGKMDLSDFNTLNSHPVNCAYNCHPKQGMTHNWFEPAGE